MKLTLKAARVNAGLSQAEVAKSLKVSQASVASWESGLSSPRIQRAMKMAELYGLSVYDIFFKQEEQ